MQPKYTTLSQQITCHYNPADHHNTMHTRYLLDKYKFLSCLGTDPELHYESNQATELLDQHPGQTTIKTYKLYDIISTIKMYR